MGYRMRETVELSDDGPGTAMFVVDELSGTSLLGDLFVAISKGFIRRDLQARAALLRAALESAPGTRSSRRAEPTMDEARYRASEVRLRESLAPSPRWALARGAPLRSRCRHALGDSQIVTLGRLDQPGRPRPSAVAGFE
jgi:hypothetical protein